jgi:N,N'-diacetyllegionaminate synthase
MKNYKQSKDNKKDRVKIIAEVGINHNGSFRTAKIIIKKLSKLDIDYIKFQIGNPDQVYSKDSFKADYQNKFNSKISIKDMSKKFQLTPKQHLLLNKICKKYGKTYSCTAFDLDSLDFLVKKINIPFIKIPSGEITSVDLLEYAAKQEKKILLSTGMATYKDIQNALKILRKYKKKEIIIMHCTSIYPARDQFLNMNVLDELKKKFNLQLGYSDHSLNDLASLAAVSKNAKFVEKHVTLDRHLKGPDHLASYNIKEFKNFVENIRKLEIILGSPEKIFSKEENQIKNMARKSVVSNVDIYKNNEISLKDITFKRPGTGISPLDYKKVLRNQLKINLEKDKVITKNMLKY